MTQQAVGGTLLAAGIVVLLIAICFPKYLIFVPGNRWFWPWGPPASRFGSIAGAGACVLIGLTAFDTIPQRALGAVAILWGAVLLAAAIHDFAQAAAKDALPTQPSIPAVRNAPRKRRKHRGRRK